MKRLFETDRFVIRRSTMASALFQLYGKQTLILLFIVMIILFIMGFTLDIRWVIVSLMVGFIISPILLAFLYFYHALTPLTSANIIPHSIDNHSDGKIRITFWQQVPADGDENNKQWEAYLTREIQESSLSRTVMLLSHQALLFDKPNKGFLLIPPSSLSNQSSTLTHTDTDNETPKR